MIRSGSPIYSRFTRSFQKKTPRVNKPIWRCNVNILTAWIILKFQQFKVSIIFICLIVGIILYYFYFKGNKYFMIKSPQISESIDNNDNDNDNDELLSFLVIGDWGANPNKQSIDNQTFVANTMKLIHDKYSTQFVISVGDHFYDHGIMDSNDQRWLTGFENIYDKSLSPWYIVFGNHDLRGSVEAQIKYSKISQNNRWIAPSSYYSKDFLIPNSKNSMFRIIFLDTNNLLCNHNEYDQLDELEKYECDEMFYKLPQTFITKHKEDDGINISLEQTLKIQNYNFGKTRDEQLKWFKEQVIDANDNDNIKFVFITGHHALFSQGPHKIPKLFNLNIQNILRLSNKIITWFCGHNHALEYYIWDRQRHSNNKQIDHLNELHQVLSGSGGRDIHKMIQEPVQSILDDVKLGFIAKEFGFVSVHLFQQQIKIQFWNQFGKSLYSQYIPYPIKIFS